MKILLVNQFFWPDPAATSQLLTDLARALTEEGHEVHAVCGRTAYARTNEAGSQPNVCVRRTPAIGFGRGPVARILSYGSFLITAGWAGLTDSRPDLVLTLTTPPLASSIGRVLQLLRGSRHFIWEMDIYPDVATDLGYIRRGSLVDRVAGLIANHNRKKADGILALGPCMRDRLIRHGVPGSLIHVAENWADGSLIQPQPISSTKKTLTLLYSGNLGLAHDVDTVRAAIGALRFDHRFMWIFAGGGTKRAALEEWCTKEQVQGVSFEPYKNREDLGSALSAGEIGLVTQRTECLGSVVPSKVYGLMAAARPILFIGPAASTAAKVISDHGCGWQVEPGDSEGLIRLLLELAADRGRIIEAGRAARRAFDLQYDVSHGVDRICRILGASSPIQIAGEIKESTTAPAAGMMGVTD